MPEQKHGHAKPLGMSNQTPPSYLPLPAPQEQVSLLLPRHTTRVGQREKKLESQGPMDSGHGQYELTLGPCPDPRCHGKEQQKQAQLEDIVY